MPKPTAPKPPTPKKYAALKKQVGKAGMQAVEKSATSRVMKHQSMTRKEAKAYVKSRTAAGKSVGGYRPRKPTEHPND